MSYLGSKIKKIILITEIWPTLISDSITFEHFLQKLHEDYLKLKINKVILVILHYLH